MTVEQMSVWVPFNYGANSSEAVEKIAADQKDDRKSSWHIPYSLTLKLKDSKDSKA